MLSPYPLILAALFAFICPRAALAAPSLQVFGDSLAVGMDSSLRSSLPGWRVSTNARVGRSLSEGMRLYSAMPHSKVVAMSLYTNDSPGNIRALRSALEKTREDARSRNGCVIWATIYCHVEGSDNYAEANRVIRRFVANHPDHMQLVDWQRAGVVNTHFISSSDGVHGTYAGYRWRGRAYARTARSC